MVSSKDDTTTIRTAATSSDDSRVKYDDGNHDTTNDNATQSHNDASNNISNSMSANSWPVPYFMIPGAPINLSSVFRYDPNDPFAAMGDRIKMMKLPPTQYPPYWEARNQVEETIIQAARYYHMELVRTSSNGKTTGERSCHLRCRYGIACYSYKDKISKEEGGDHNNKSSDNNSNSTTTNGKKKQIRNRKSSKPPKGQECRFRICLRLRPGEFWYIPHCRRDNGCHNHPPFPTRNRKGLPSSQQRQTKNNNDAPSSNNKSTNNNNKNKNEKIANKNQHPHDVMQHPEFYFQNQKLQLDNQQLIKRNQKLVEENLKLKEELALFRLSKAASLHNTTVHPSDSTGSPANKRPKRNNPK